MGQCVKKRCVGGGWDEGVNDSEGDCTVVVDTNLAADREARVRFSQEGGGQVGPADTD